jgi:hypothetical protein
MTTEAQPAAPPDYLARLLAQLQAALGVAVRNGQIRLNLNEGRVQSFETRTFQRVNGERNSE